jgi:hypothetical protein
MLIVLLVGSTGCLGSGSNGGSDGGSTSGSGGGSTTCSGAAAQNAANYGFVYVNPSTRCGAQQPGLFGPVAVLDTFYANTLAEATQCAQGNRPALITAGYTPMTDTTLYSYQICLGSSNGMTFGVIWARSLSDAAACAQSTAQAQGASSHGVCSPDFPCSC